MAVVQEVSAIFIYIYNSFLLYAEAYPLNFDQNNLEKLEGNHLVLSL